jgi:predicted DNA-binding protein with PD1-like motif
MLGADIVVDLCEAHVCIVAQTVLVFEYCSSFIGYTEYMKTTAKRLTDGQDLMQEIKQLLDEHGVQAGVILSAVGSLKQPTIRVPVINDEVKYIHPENLEIDSLHGTVSKNGCHLHISVSDLDGKVWGGHLKEGCIIRTTCELVIGVLEDKTFTREMDDATGFEELHIAEETKQ